MATYWAPTAEIGWLMDDLIRRSLFQLDDDCFRCRWNINGLLAIKQTWLNLAFGPVELYIRGGFPFRLTAGFNCNSCNLSPFDLFIHFHFLLAFFLSFLLFFMITTYEFLLEQSKQFLFHVRDRLDDFFLLPSIPVLSWQC